MKTDSVAQLLGMTQREMAQILGVHPSQYSMFESGMRSLPVAAMQLLAEMMRYVRQPALERQGESNGDSNPHLHKELERLMRENEYQRLALQKNYEKEKRQAESLRNRELVNQFLRTHSGNIRTFAKAYASENSNVALLDAKLARLEMKLETLELEHLVLSSKLRKAQEFVQKISPQS